MSQGSDPVPKVGNSSGNKGDANQSHADSKVSNVPDTVSRPGTSVKDA